MNPSISGIYLAPEHWQQMKADIVTRSHEEACGVVAGENNHSRKVIPITNLLHDASRFQLDPGEELKAFMLIENNGWDLLAVYHSHPHGIDHPSPTDIEELTIPGIIYLIWYQEADDWKCRGYLMQGKTKVSEVPVSMVQEK